MRIKNYILQLLLALVIGIIPTIWVIQNNYYAKQYALQTLIKKLEKQWNANIVFKYSTINFFTGCLALHNITITSKNAIPCVWHALSGKLYILKQSSLQDNCINLHIELKNNTIKTGYINKTLGFTNLLNSIFDVQSKYFCAKSFLIKNASFISTIADKKVSLALFGSVSIKKDTSNLWQGRLSLHNGNLIYENNTIINNLKGITQFHQSKDPDNSFQLQSQKSFISPYLNKKDRFSLQAQYNDNKKNIAIKNESESFFMNSHINTSSKQYCTGTIILNDFIYNDFTIKQFLSKFALTKNHLKTNFTLKQNKDAQFTGTATWNISNNLSLSNPGSLSIFNKTPIIIFDKDWFSIPKNNLVLNATIQNNAIVKGTYSAHVINKQTAKTQDFQGNFLFDTFKVISSGKSPYGNHYIEANLTDKLPVSKIIIKKNNITVALFQKKEGDPNTLIGKIKHTFLHKFLPLQIKKYFLGNKGIFDLECTYQDKTLITGKLSFSNGKIYIPNNYNLLTNFKFDFSLLIPTRELLLDRIYSQFAKGEIVCNHAWLQQNTTKKTWYMHAPIQIKNFLINWKNNFLGIIQGNIFIEKKKQEPLSVCGDIIIKKSLFKENILSEQTEHNLISSSIIPFLQNTQTIKLDFNVTNEENLTIKTQFLQAQATADLQIKADFIPNTFFIPQITGDISFRQGSLTFPRNTLFITSGKVYFIHNQMNNPMIDLIAKNRIKKYIISLHITGSLQKPTIFLESNPELTEEQIIALLFAGSENVSLSSDLPAIIMQNLHLLLLGSKKQLPKAISFFSKLTQPLKYIQITPNFTDQSGRGGVKGTISIDVNKQLHAQIQKNLTMQDDLAFQLEYFLSDDLNIKAIKDHRGDIGAELEIRLIPGFF